jgi:hypothetical protein
MDIVTSDTLRLALLAVVLSIIYKKFCNSPKLIFSKKFTDGYWLLRIITIFLFLNLLNPFCNGPPPFFIVLMLFVFSTIITFFVSWACRKLIYLSVTDKRMNLPGCIDDYFHQEIGFYRLHRKLSRR